MRVTFKFEGIKFEGIVVDEEKGVAEVYVVRASPGGEQVSLDEIAERVPRALVRITSRELESLGVLRGEIVEWLEEPEVVEQLVKVLKQAVATSEMRRKIEMFMDTQALLEGHVEVEDIKRLIEEYFKQLSKRTSS